MATVGDKIVGIPALVDNLALVYNKKLFAKAGIPTPTPTWTWSDFENAAIKLTDPATKQFGWAYVNDASEDTVWRFWAMLWQAGGSILSPDGKQAAFNSPAGLKAMTLLQTLANKHAIYLDNGSDNYLPRVQRRPHRHAVDRTVGSRSRSSQSKVDYGVTILPGDANHQTISGPDNWVMFNNGQAHTQAAWTFLKWLTSPGDRPQVGDDDRRPADPRLGRQAARLHEVHRQVPRHLACGRPTSPTPPSRARRSRCIRRSPP